MFIDFLSAVFEEHASREAIVWNGTSCSYAWLIDKIRDWQEEITRCDIKKGTVVAIEGAFSPTRSRSFWR